jgi:hypothetical protein
MLRLGFSLKSYAVGGNGWFGSKAAGGSGPGANNLSRTRYLCHAVSVLFLLWCWQSLQASPSVLDTNLQLRLILYTTNTSAAPSIRIAKDPRDNQLYYLKYNGDIFQLNVSPGSGSTSVIRYNSADHGISNNALGMAIGPDGTIYILGNSTTNSGNSTFARVMKGVPDSSGARVWSLLARTEPYPQSRTAFDHLMSCLAVSPDGQSLYVNSVSRTDHGEVESTGGIYPNLRETGLTAKILRLPANRANLILTNDLDALRHAGYVFAEGTRNAFSLAFAPNGDFFATDNGPDRDMSDELNWIRAGLHFGFPWRMGGSANPQQFPGYDPATDLLLDSRYVAVSSGTYQNDPTFPPPPTNFFEPVINIGPDADNYRDPSDGSIKDASTLGLTINTFTAHRSPLGLVFDTSGAMGPPYQQHGFMLSWNPGDPTGNTVAGPFMDPSQDLVDLNLTKIGTNYQARVTRLVGGFSNPIDAVIISNRIYVVEYSGSQGVWEITFPAAAATPPRIVVSQPTLFPGGPFSFYFNTVSGQTYQIMASTNLLDWSTATAIVATNSTFQFVEPSPATFLNRFYRVAP